MSFPSTTALNASTADASTLVPCSKASALNEITLGVLLQALGQVGSVTPTALAANTDNWASATGTINYISASAAYNLTGIVAEALGSPKLLWNTGTFPITLVNELTSTAANRFTCAGGASIVLGPGEVALTIYNTTTSRWLCTKIRSDIAQGTLIVRYDGGTSSTQGQISHSGNDILLVNTVGNRGTQITNPGANIVMFPDTRVGLPSTCAVIWSSNSDGSGGDTGLKRAAAGVVAVTDGSSGNGTLRVGPGTVAAPSLAFATETNTGCYLPSVNVIGTSIAGFAISSMNINGLISLPVNGGIGWQSTTTVTSGVQDTSIARVAAGVVGGSGVWLQNTGGTKRVTANVTNATTTYSNLADLTVTLIAGRKYVGRMMIHASNDVSADGMKFDFNGGSATMTDFWAQILAYTAGLTASNTGGSALATVLNYTAVGTGNITFVVELSFVCNAAGTFIPRFAQNAHTSGTATLLQGSYLVLEDSPN